LIGRSIEWKEKISKSHTGKKLSEDHKNSISKMLTGRVLSDEHILNLRGKKAGAKGVLI